VPSQLSVATTPALVSPGIRGPAHGLEGGAERVQGHLCPVRGAASAAGEEEREGDEARCHGPIVPRIFHHCPHVPGQYGTCPVAKNLGPVTFASEPKENLLGFTATTP
jgi:hypothetical protein